MVAFCSASFIESVKQSITVKVNINIFVLFLFIITVILTTTIILQLSFYSYFYHFSISCPLHSTLKQQTADLKVFVDCRLIAGALKLINPIAKCRGRPSFVTLYSL